MVTLAEFEEFAKQLKYENISRWSDWRYRIQFEPHSYTYGEMKKLLQTKEIHLPVLAYLQNQYIANTSFRIG